MIPVTLKGICNLLSIWNNFDSEINTKSPLLWIFLMIRNEIQVYILSFRCKFKPRVHANRLLSLFPWPFLNHFRKK